MGKYTTQQEDEAVNWQAKIAKGVHEALNPDAPPYDLKIFSGAIRANQESIDNTVEAHRKFLESGKSFWTALEESKRQALNPGRAV